MSKDQKDVSSFEMIRPDPMLTSGWISTIMYLLPLFDKNLLIIAPEFSNQ